MKHLARMFCLALALFALPLFAALADLQRGDESEEVANLQQMLFESGWLFELPDGKFGPNTEEAVRNYESYAGLPVDGIADDVMIESLTEDWMRLMQEMGQYEGAEGGDTDGGMYPAFCNHWNMADGNSKIDYCETHMQIHIQAEQLMATGELDDAKQACALWQTEIIRLYDQWFVLSDEANRASIAAAKALYLSSMETRRLAMEAWYACFQSPPSAEQVEYALELPLREHAAWLCAVLSGSLAEGGMGE